MPKAYIEEELCEWELRAGLVGLESVFWDLAIFQPICGCKFHRFCAVESSIEGTGVRPWKSDNKLSWLLQRMTFRTSMPMEINPDLGVETRHASNHRVGHSKIYNEKDVKAQLVELGNLTALRCFLASNKFCWNDDETIFEMKIFRLYERWLVQQNCLTIRCQNPKWNINQKASTVVLSDFHFKLA